MSRKFAMSRGLILGVVLLICIVSVFLFVRGTTLSPSEQAAAVVEEFYRYEQEGEFSSSWSLFHSEMKKRFGKGNYNQDRAHVFMNHFGVETFDFSISEPEEIKAWKMTKTGAELKGVYKVLVTQTYKGKYGNFDLKQEVYIVKEKEEWKILWDYNQ